jgi:NAD(P)H dehydrogenase (quinone)
VSATFIEGNLERVRHRAAGICARMAQELVGTPLPQQMGDGS